MQSKSIVDRFWYALHMVSNDFCICSKYDILGSSCLCKIWNQITQKKRYGTRTLVSVHVLALGCANMKHLLLLVIFSAYAAMDNALLLKCYKHEPCAYFLCAVRVSYV